MKPQISSGQHLKLQNLISLHIKYHPILSSSQPSILFTSPYPYNNLTPLQLSFYRIAMATASATYSPPMLAAARRKTGVHVNYITGWNSFGGLKAHNKVVSLRQPVCIEQSFANVVRSLKVPSSGKGRGRGGGGALSSTCNAVSEIFRIAAIMNGLVLVGVAVGFVLLRIEASLEEAES